jgi:hypothetical protein
VIKHAIENYYLLILPLNGDLMTNNFSQVNPLTNTCGQTYFRAVSKIWYVLKMMESGLNSEWSSF